MPNLWCGEYQLGDRLPITLWVRDTSQLPTLPDAPPRAIVSSSTEQVQSFLLPIIDQSNETAVFHYDLNLDGRYSAGMHTVQLIWALSSVVMSEIRRFNVLSGGDGTGTGIAVDFFSVPPIRHLVIQTDAGNLIKRKNPRIP